MHLISSIPGIPPENKSSLQRLCRYMSICSPHSIYAAGCSDLVSVQCFHIGGRGIASLAVKDLSEIPKAGPSLELVLQSLCSRGTSRRSGGNHLSMGSQT